MGLIIINKNKIINISYWLFTYNSICFIYLYILISIKIDDYSLIIEYELFTISYKVVF